MFHVNTSFIFILFFKKTGELNEARMRNIHEILAEVQRT